VTDQRDVERLMASIATRTPVDWEDAGRLARDDAERARIETLRDVARIADFSQAQQSAGPAMPLPFERWGELVLLERLGEGAHAEVFRAWDSTLRREVALKLLRGGAPLDADASPLLDEGRAAARVRHAQVVTIFGVAQHEGRVGLWMELARGPSLERWVERRGALGPREAADLGVAVGSAVAAVHEAGLLHRDIKPANVVHDPDRRWMLADFGLGVRDAAGAGGARVLGTPMFMAPECLDGARPSERAEVYALGLLLWFALMGRHPYRAERVDDLREELRAGLPRLRAERPEVPDALDAIVARATATRPEDRYASARELVEALDAWLAGAARGPARGRRASRSVAVVVAVLVLGVAAGFLLRRQQDRGAREPGPAQLDAVAGAYDVEAVLERHADDGVTRLAAGDRVRPGDDLALSFRSTRPAWVYVLNEDDAGERYLLFPQPLFDARNPLPADSAVRLPGTIGGRPNFWTVSSPGGREKFLVVASPEPVAALEAVLAAIPVPREDRPIRYSAVSGDAIDELRGTGALTARGPSRPGNAAASVAFEHFRALADRESGVRGVWVRQIVLENP
jgi:hypothetical protein